MKWKKVSNNKFGIKLNQLKPIKELKSKIFYRNEEMTYVTLSK